MDGGSAARYHAIMLRYVLLLTLFAFPGCASDDDYSYNTADPAKEFRDDAQTNVAIEAVAIGDLRFVDRDGQPVDLAQYKGQKNVVLVITRGQQGAATPRPGQINYGDVCLYCATQTAGLKNNYAKFQQRDAEVVVVYPVPTKETTDKLKTFETVVNYRGGTSGPSPFPLLLDLELKAVDQLGIRHNLARPATYILDKNGNARFAYVGKTLGDRPSIKAILAQLDTINGQTP